MDHERVRSLLGKELFRFCRAPRVLKAAEAVELLREIVSRPRMDRGADGAIVTEDEEAMFAAIALAVAGDDAGAAILRPDSANSYSTNSGIEIAR